MTPAHRPPRPLLPPERQRFRIELPPGLKDDAGRTLANARSFPLVVRTDENPPLVKFAADFGILERVLPKGERPMLPVTVRNVEPSIAGARSRIPVPGNVARVAGDDGAVIAWFRRLAYANRVGYEEGFVFGGGSAVIAPDGAELLVADPLEPEELTAKLDAGALRRARVANPAHGIERHELLIEALARAARPREASEGIAGDREEARP